MMAAMAVTVDGCGAETNDGAVAPERRRWRISRTGAGFTGGDGRTVVGCARLPGISFVHSGRGSGGLVGP